MSMPSDGSDDKYMINLKLVSHLYRDENNDNCINDISDGHDKVKNKFFLDNTKTLIFKISFIHNLTPQNFIFPKNKGTSKKTIYDYVGILLIKVDFY